MKKIAFLNATLYGGGIEKLLADIVNRLPPEKYEVTVYNVFEGTENVLNSNISYDYAYRDYHSNNRVKNILARVYNKFVTYKGIQKVLTEKLNKKHFDVIVSMKEGLLTQIAAGASAPRKIAWVLTDVNSGDSSNDYIKSNYQPLKNAYRSVDKVVVCTNYAEEGVQKVFGPLANCTVIPNFVSEKEVIEKSRCESEIQKSKEKFTFVCVGRLSHEKGQKILLEACGELNKSKKDIYEVWIIGDGADRAELERIQQEQKLDNVIFLGNKANPYAYMAKADGLVLPSKTEGFGLVITEGMFLNLPIVATRTAGARDILAEGEYGILTDISAHSLAEGMVKLMDEKEYYEQKSQIRKKEYEEAGILAKIMDVLNGA